MSQHRPLPRSLFLGMAALSSWLGWSSLYADSKPLAVYSCQEFIILHRGTSFPLTNKSRDSILYNPDTTKSGQICDILFVIKKIRSHQHLKQHNFMTKSTLFNGIGTISELTCRVEINMIEIQISVVDH